MKRNRNREKCAKSLGREEAECIHGMRKGPCDDSLRALAQESVKSLEIR